MSVAKVATKSVARLASNPDTPPHVIAGRKRLVKAATKLFRERSFHATSISDVAHEAKISVGAVYLYIETKSDLLILIFNEAVAEYVAGVYRINDFEGSASEKLARAIHEYYSVLDRHYRQTEIMYHEFNAMDADAKAYVRKVEQDLEDAMNAVVSSGVSSGEFAQVDTRLYARNILWIGHLWALNRGSVRSSMSIDEFIDAQTDHFLRSLGVHRER